MRKQLIQVLFIILVIVLILSLFIAHRAINSVSINSLTKLFTVWGLSGSFLSMISDRSFARFRSLSLDSHFIVYGCMGSRLYLAL